MNRRHPPSADGLTRERRASGHLVDLHAGETYPATVEVEEGRIARVRRTSDAPDRFLLPGLVDAHVHVESSMLVPYEFGRHAARHGTVATVSDPHEIANVLGVDGIDFMLESARAAPIRIHFGAPSCVPATPFESAGAELDADAVADLLDRPGIGYLSEMMNYPGVVAGDPEVHAKLEAARMRGKPIDGHAPGLRGADLEAYAAAGISTDHECFTLEEARAKLELGMHVLIREGSAARNFDELLPLLREAPERCMFCTDDAHPDDLMRGHVDVLVRRALAAGIDRYDVLRCASLNPVRHYGLDVGLLREGDRADFIEVDGFEDFRVLRTVVGGRVVAEGGRSLLPARASAAPNRFREERVGADAFAVAAKGDRVRVIGAVDGQIVTQGRVADAPVVDGEVRPDPERDLLKIAVVDRYSAKPPAVGLIEGFGLRTGAMASSVAHDSHHVVAVGVSDEALAAAVNALVDCGGGLSVAGGPDGSVSHGSRPVRTLPLPVAGLMSTEEGPEVARRYSELDGAAKALGSTLSAPFMTLSFMALLVIPSLKMSDGGLFDGEAFDFVDLFV